jgi:uncharacterized protein (DUF2141 family)
MDNKYLHIVFYVLLLIIAACAQVVTPTGGAKDTTPPKVLHSVPGNYETNYTGNTLTLHFDEFVQVKDASSEIIISPMIGANPQIKIKGKSVEIKFDTLTQANTTYTVNLGKAIVDNNEGNVLDSNLFVFSTGAEIDSMMLKGKILDAEWKKPEKDMFVMLYADTAKASPLTKRPDYIAKTNENGEFKIYNIKKGSYRIFALNDKNGNYLFDLPDEHIAFSNELAQVDTSDNTYIELYSFKEAADKQFVVSSEFTQYGKLRIIFNLPTENLNINVLNHSFKKAWYLTEENTTKDTLHFWLTDIDGLDSLILEISNKGEIIDTLELEILKKPSEQTTSKGGRGSGKASSFELNAQLNAGGNNPLNYNDTLIITWSHPINSFEKSGYVLTQAKDTIPLKIETIDAALRKHAVFFNYKEDSTYKLNIIPNNVEDIFGLKNDTVQFSFKIQNKNHYGKIILSIENIETQGKDFIIQLLDDKNAVLKSITKSNLEVTIFEYLQPGSYSFRLILDENRNKKWDTGDYLNEQQPEKTIIYNGTVSVKSNFDSDIKWKIE